MNNLNKSKTLIQNEINSIKNQIRVLNPFIELVLSDATNNRNDKNDYYFIHYDLNNKNEIKNNDLLLEKQDLDRNRETNYDKNSRAYCKQHFNFLFNQSKEENNNNNKNAQQHCNLFFLFDKENQSKKLVRLKLKLNEFCSRMNDVFSYEQEVEFDPLTLIKIFIVNFRNTMTVPIRIEPIYARKLRKELLNLNSSSGESINLKIKNTKKTNLLKTNKNYAFKRTYFNKNKWYMPKKYWFKKI